MKKINLLQPSCTQEEIDAVTEVLKSGWWGTGPKTIEFEQKFTEYTHSKGCIAVNSCTSALHLALRLALRNHETDQPNIVVPSLTFVSTGLVGLYENVEVRFADIDPSTLCMDMNSAIKLVDKNTVAVIPVHYGGVTADVEKLQSLLHQQLSDAFIIEDCAHAAGNPDVGKVGIVSCWSFHPVKNLATGDMGAITYNDLDNIDVEIMIQERWCGINQDTYKREKSGYNWEYNISRMGYKYNTNDIMASIGLVQLKRIWEMNGKRAIIADRYYKGLKDLPILNLMPKSGSWHLFVIRVAEELRNPLVDFLRESGISPGVHYKPIHTYPIWNREITEYLSITEDFSKQIISLPIHADLTEEEQKYVIAKLKEFFHARED